MIPTGGEDVHFHLAVVFVQTFVDLEKRGETPPPDIAQKLKIQQVASVAR